MGSSKGKKILVPVDGSAQSLDTIKYVSQIMPASSTRVVLFHVLSKIPEHFRDIGIIPSTFSEELVEAMEVSVKRQRSTMQDFMEKARGIFVDAGFPQSNIAVEIREMKTGFARDIAAEAPNHDATAVGRKGTNPLQDMVLGSIASKLTVNYCRIPVWLIGGNPGNRKILIAMDSSNSAMEAVDHVAGVLNSGAEEIRLIHAVRGIRSVSEGYQNIFVGDYLDKLNREAAERIQPVFDEAVDHLTAMGIASSRITSTIVTGVGSRAGAIFRAAEREDFGTIVLGRKGMTKPSNCDMGRVAYKLVHIVANRALWVVGC